MQTQTSGDNPNSERSRQAPRPLRLLQTFWGLAAVVGLGVVTVYDVLAPEAASEAPASATLNVASAPAPAATATPASIVASALAGVQYTVYLGCTYQDAKDAHAYLPAPGLFTQLSLSENLDEVARYLDDGLPDIPDDAWVVETVCFQERKQETVAP